MLKSITVCGGVSFDTSKSTADEAYEELLSVAEKVGIYIDADLITLWDEDGSEIEEIDME